jgi:hypothetical protein
VVGVQVADDRTNSLTSRQLPLHPGMTVRHAAILRCAHAQRNRVSISKADRVVLLPENLHAYFVLSAQAWILYKAPQWNAHYPNSCPERIKL